MFFGSALWNFGVRLLLDALVGLAPAAGPRWDRLERPHALTEPYSGFVFKIQPNLDPPHRDRSAYLRVASEVFERGKQVTNVRTARGHSTKYAQQLFGRERDTVEQAY